MPYKSVEDLPKGVKDHLPQHGKEIYLSAFNNAIKEYSKYSDSEERAHKVAWSAVKKKYTKGSDGNWHKKGESNESK